MSDLVIRSLAGAAAGLTATGPMTFFMAAARTQLPADEQHPLPPRRITMRAAEAAGVRDDMTEPQKQAATGVAHFGYGTATGAIYGAISPHLPFGPVLNGVAYGLGVWAGSYLGLLPALDLHPPATREAPSRNALMIGAHVVWGAVLGLVTDQLVGHDDRNAHDGRTAEGITAPNAPLVLGGA